MTNPHHDMSSSLDDMKRALVDAVPVVTRFLSALWNLMMKGLIAIKVMPYIVKMPWLLAVLILALIIICPFLAILLLPMALIAYSRGVTAIDQFLIPMGHVNDSPLDDIDQTPL